MVCPLSRDGLLGCKWSEPLTARSPHGPHYRGGGGRGGIGDVWVDWKRGTGDLRGWDHRVNMFV